MEKVTNLKSLFNQFNIEGYIIPKNDEFFGEYVDEKKDRLKHISNFTGSYGFALILKKKNYLFTDGRYLLQAKIESSKKFNISIIPKKLPFKVLKNKKIIIGFDPKLFTEMSLKRIFINTKCKLLPIKDNLPDLVTKIKSKSQNKKFFLLKKKDAGQSRENKISKLVSKLKRNKFNAQFISAPENVAWLLNLRGGDSEFSPIPNCYAIVSKERKVSLFCELNKINKLTRKSLKSINFVNIEDVEKFLETIRNKKIQIDKNSCSIFFKDIIEKNNKIIETQDPIYILKSIKNKTEIRNMTKTHILDGVAVTKFLFWIKNNFRFKKITEISAQEKLLKFRKNNKNFKMLSFPTISGSGPNGAIVHYRANEKSNRTIKKGDIYLNDSGGQYAFGTTDVTRTISLENKNKRIKEIFTRVLKGHIAVANYKITTNTYGSKIDLAARKYLHQINLDYSHGTGHGVGYFLNVHEGPQALSKGNKINFKEGMILSNEPGYYEKGKFGIRIENLITIKKINKKLKFVNLTLIPIDKSLIQKKLLSRNEIDWLNNYHRNVYKNLKKYMNNVELKQLKIDCSNI